MNPKNLQNLPNYFPLNLVQPLNLSCLNRQVRHAKNGFSSALGPYIEGSFTSCIRR